VEMECGATGKMYGYTIECGHVDADPAAASPVSIILLG